jgi:DNA-directed RNA polymerase alpha subunit
MTICANCKFWDREMVGSGAEMGECRRNAPAAFHSIRNPDSADYKEFEIVTALWPRTHEEEWCGEYGANPATADMSRSLDDLPMGNMAKNTLRTHGLATVSDVMGMTRANLLHLGNFGRGSLNQLELALETMGLKLRSGAVL